MGAGKKLAAAAGAQAAPKVGWSFVRQALDKAIDGIGPLRSAAESATTHMVDAHGDVEQAIATLTRTHVVLAGAQGFVTNLGGIATVPVSVPANVAGVTLLQAHLVAGIAHLRGYDLDDPRVRNAILGCMLGPDKVKELVKRHSLPAYPMGIATAEVHDPGLDRLIASELTGELVARTIGRRAVTLMARRIPGVGGVVAGGTDAYQTRQVGQYAATELKDRRL
ncbi:EcsC family protein [Aeromicrobium alkaliterrae]|uniref:EcsC family protein n=1 Tax=Aeromicrobium alkaliterrae TaxID=302168 RepID=A0ABP4W2F2_9ACTN